LLDPMENAEARAKLTATADKLGHGGASKRAADLILRILGAEAASNEPEEISLAEKSR
jgi:hypothetical protein